MLLRTLLLFALVYTLGALTVSRLMPLPVDPLLRAGALLVPVITGLVVVSSWHEAGAPWPRLSRRWRARARRWSLAFGAY
jgi:hypothetical protein